MIDQTTESTATAGSPPASGPDSNPKPGFEERVEAFGRKAEAAGERFGQRAPRVGQRAPRVGPGAWC